MRHTLKSITLTILGLLDLFPVRSTPKQEVLDFFSKLHPRKAGKGLIRLGPAKDGGYLVPDDLDGIAACFSPGVDIESGFELACAEKGMKVFMADGSVDQPPLSHDLFTFQKKFIGSSTNSTTTTLDDWVRESIPDPDSELIL